MAQRKPEEKTTLDQVLKLADQLTPEEQDQLVEQMKLQWLRRAADQAEESLAQGKVYSEEEVMAFLDEHHRQRLERQKK